MNRHSKALALACLLAVAIASAPRVAEAQTQLGRLTALDGTPGGKALGVSALSVEVRLDGRLAHTEITHVFQNPLSRRAEGLFEIALPPGAVLTRVAMDVGGDIMEGELVDRQKARTIYEGIVEEFDDPALTEWRGDHTFTTRIFPLPARGPKTVIVGYDHLVPVRADRLSYHLALSKGMTVRNFKFHLRSTGVDLVNVENYNPVVNRGDTLDVLVEAPAVGPLQGPLKINFRASALPSLYTSSRGIHDHFILDLLPRLPPPSTSKQRDLVIAVDTSASIDKHTMSQVTGAALSLLESLSDGARYSLVLGDFKTRTCVGTPMPAGKLDAARRCLRQVEAGGGSDLGGLLQAAAKLALRHQRPTDVVVLTDGVPSLGTLKLEDLGEAFSKLIKNRPVALHTIAVGHHPALGPLKGLSRGAHGLSMRLPPGRVARTWSKQVHTARHTPYLSDLKARVVSGEVDGLGVMAHDQALALVGRLKSSRATVALSGRLAGKLWQHRVSVSMPEEIRYDARVAHLWAREKIAAMIRAEAPRQKIIDTSRIQGVMSPHTSFLVLESDKAYRDNDIERTQQHERLRRHVAPIRRGPPTPPPASRPIKASRHHRIPKITFSGKPIVTGALDKKIFRSVIRKNLPKLRHCYTHHQGPRRMLMGRVEVRFEVTPHGIVRRADIESSDLHDPDIEACISHNVRRLRFPEVVNGTLSTIYYPVVFVPEDLPDGPTDENSRIKALEGRHYLHPMERGELLGLYLTQSRPQEAWHYHKAQARALEGMGTGALLQLYQHDKAREVYQSHYRAVVIARLREKSPPMRLARQLWEATMKEGRPDELPAIFSKVHVHRGVARLFLAELADIKRPELALSLVRGWLDARITSPLGAYAIMERLDEPAQSLPDALYEVTRRALAHGSPDPEIMEDHIRAGVASDHKEAVVEALVRRCKKPGKELEACQGWARLIEGDKAVDALLAILEDTLIGRMKKARESDPGDVMLISQHAETLMSMGRPDESRRLLSEIVEHEAFDALTYAAYADALDEQGEHLAACRALSTAMWLDPGDRDHVVNMARLGEAEGAPGAAMRGCLLDALGAISGGSDLTIVLTWEAEEVDLDLEVSSPEGTLYHDGGSGDGIAVWYQAKAPESALEVTISNPFPDGEDPLRIKGHMTVIRNAGLSGETRRTRPFELQRWAPKVTLKVQSPVSSAN